MVFYLVATQIFVVFTPKPWGFMIQFDDHIFSNGLKPPTSFSFRNITSSLLVDMYTVVGSRHGSFNQFLGEALQEKMVDAFKKYLQVELNLYIETWEFMIQKKVKVCFLGGGFKYFLFSPLLGEDSHFD